MQRTPRRRPRPARMRPQSGSAIERGSPTITWVTAPAPVDQHAHLPPDLAGELGQLPGEVVGQEPVGREPALREALELLDVVGLQAVGVAEYADCELLRGGRAGEVGISAGGRGYRILWPGERPRNAWSPRGSGRAAGHHLASTFPFFGYTHRGTVWGSAPVQAAAPVAEGSGDVAVKTGRARDVEGEEPMAPRERPLAVVILAAGQGTRMKSDRAKVLHDLGGRPLLAYPLGAAEALAPERLVVVIGRDAEQVEAAFAGRVRFVVQARAARHRARGPAGGARAARLPRRRPRALRRRAAAARGDARAHAGQEGGERRRPRAADLARAASRARRARRGRARARIVEVTDATPEELRIREGNTGVYLLGRRAALEVPRRSSTTTTSRASST